MAQVSQITIDNQSFPNFRTALNNSLGAINSSHIGSSRPSSAVAGLIWIDNGTTNTYKVKIFDGSDDLQIFEINTSTNAVSLPTGVTVSESDPNSIPFSVALGS